MPVSLKSSSARDYEGRNVMEIQLTQNIVMDFNGMSGQQRKDLMENMNYLIEQFIEKLLSGVHSTH